MAEITTTINARRKVGVTRQNKHPRTDMTPMVDLGFLLITFFVITTELSKPLTMDLAIPHDGAEMPLGMSDALTVLLDKNNTIYYYHGDWDKASKTNQVFKTSFSINDGIGKVIREKQQWLDIKNTKERRNGLMLLIKPGENAEYGNVVDMLDEALIHDVKKYAVLKPQTGEIKYLNIQK